MDFMPGNRWHGVVGGQDVNVYAGSLANTRMGTGKVIIQFDQPGRPTRTVNLLSPHTGQLMIVSADRTNRLTLWDTDGYWHTLLLDEDHSRLTNGGHQVAIRADAMMPAAGVCGGARDHLVTVGVGAGDAYPRCVRVFADEALRVENRSDDQPPRTSFTVGFPTLPATTLHPGQSVVFSHPFAGLAPGVHSLHLSHLSMDVWVR